MKIVARSKKNVCIAWTDFYSFAHVMMGMIAFLVSFIIMCFIVIDFYDRLIFCLLSSTYFGIAWEIFENFILIKTRFKFCKRKDSLQNSVSDEFFVIIGSFIEMYLFLSTDILVLFIISNVILLLSLYCLYLYFKGRTLI